MGFLRSLYRLIASAFGLAQGSTERASDQLLIANAETIRSQFRKTREDWIKDHSEMRSAVADLCSIRDGKQAEHKKLLESVSNFEQMMAGAIEQFQRTKNEQLRVAYTKFASEKEQAELRATELLAEIVSQTEVIESHKARLQTLAKDIENLKTEEAATVADITSARKIQELNDRLGNLSTDTQGKNLEAIREARAKAVSVAKLSNELKHNDTTTLEKTVLLAGQQIKHSSAFDQALNLAAFEAPKQLETQNVQPQVKTSVPDPLDALFS